MSTSGPGRKELEYQIQRSFEAQQAVLLDEARRRQPKEEAEAAARFDAAVAAKCAEYLAARPEPAVTLTEADLVPENRTRASWLCAIASLAITFLLYLAVYQ